MRPSMATYNKRIINIYQKSSQRNSTGTEIYCSDTYPACTMLQTYRHECVQQLNSERISVDGMDLHS